MLSSGFFQLVIEAGLVAKLLLLVLLVFSVVLWAIVGLKLMELGIARRQTVTFLKLFRAGADPEQIYQKCRRRRTSPLAGLFCSAHEFLLAQAVHGRGWTGDREDLWKLLDGMASQHMGRLERWLPFLATVANVSPFLGLLGTVWGVMTAFSEIGLQGSANLAVVAPGMAEALSTTAAGLAAAIPAVVAYNYFNARLNGFQRELDRFAAELAAVLMASQEVGPA